MPVSTKTPYSLDLFVKSQQFFNFLHFISFDFRFFLNSLLGRRKIVNRFVLAVRPYSGKLLSLLFKNIWFVDLDFALTINETLNWHSSLPILMQETFWWRQCSDRYIISLSPLPLHTPSAPSPSLISLMVFVDVIHHVCLLTCAGQYVSQNFK